MGAAACAKILLCWPPVANNANLVTDYVKSHLTSNGQLPALPDDLVNKLIKLGEEAEKSSEAAVAEIANWLGYGKSAMNVTKI